MKKSAYPVLSLDAELLLEELGRRISVARRARLLTQADLAAQTGIGLSTLHQIERGAPTVQIGYFVNCLWALDLLQELDAAVKELGRHTGLAERAEQALPKRIRQRKAAQ